MTTLSEIKKHINNLEDQTTKTDVRYPTGVVIDLRGPQGNIFYLQGVCNQIIRELGLSAEEKEQFARELEDKNYNDRLDIMQRWFGILYIGRNN